MSARPDARRPVPLPRPLQILVDDARTRWSTTTRPERGSAAAALGEALGREELRVAYQPIVELGEQRTVAVEALVRLPDPPHPDLDGASAVIAVAEASGLVHALGAEVLFHACSQVVAWRRLPHLPDLQVHVNVSPLQLRDDRFVGLVERCLEVTGLPPRALILEVTETAAFEGDGVAEAVLTTLSSRDVEISIDDFGTGFASLELLASTPARSIKLDRSFVASVGEVTQPPRGRALVVQAAIGLGRALGLRVVAEGVETAAQARTLRAWGCVYGQGYLYAKPAWHPAFVLIPPEPDVAPRPAVWDRSPQLSAEALDLALAIATVATTANPANPGGATVRADARELALDLAEVLALDRRAADTAALLATIADAPQRFAEIVNVRSAVAASVELARVLDSRSHLGAEATPGSVAATARRLAMARCDGATIEDALASLPGEPGDAVRDRVTAWWQDPTPSPSPFHELRQLEHRLRHRDDATRRLRALSTLTHAIGGSGTLTDVLEVTAEEARVALGASSLSIARFERERGGLRTLVNVGDLAAWQQPRPEDETYALADLPTTVGRLMDRAVHLTGAAAVGAATPESRLLDRLDKGSSAAVPIVIDHVTWGGVHATTAVGAPPFTTADTPFLTAIASVVGLAVQRSEHVDHLSRLAEEDPLTRIGNRRALEDRLARALRPTEFPADGRGTDAAGDAAGDAATLHGSHSTAGDPREVGLLMVDVEGLTATNAVHGHAEGDRMLVRVADVIARVALTCPGAFPARSGGDEFCLVLEGGGDGVEELVERIRTRLADGPSPRPTISAGFASVRVGRSSVVELLRRADAAQYLAAGTGTPLVTLGPDSDVPDPTDIPRDDGRDTLEPGNGRATDAALRRWVDTLEDRSPLTGLQGLGEAAGTLLDLNRWVISEHLPPVGMIRTHSVHVRRRHPLRPEFHEPEDEERFALADYPMTAAALRDDVGFSVHVDDVSADRQERELLLEYGQRYLIAIPAADAERQWLLELYGDELSTQLPEARPVVEALASRTLRREVACPPNGTRHASS